MRQLTSIDAQFLTIEDGRTHGHVTAVEIDDPSAVAAGQLTHDAVRDLVSARLHLLPPFSAGRSSARRSRRPGLWPARRNSTRSQ
jgi:hypothetical protein